MRTRELSNVHVHVRTHEVVGGLPTMRVTVGDTEIEGVVGLAWEQKPMCLPVLTIRVEGAHIDEVPGL